MFKKKEDHISHDLKSRNSDRKKIYRPKFAKTEKKSETG